MKKGRKEMKEATIRSKDVITGEGLKRRYLKDESPRGIFREHALLHSRHHCNNLSLKPL